MPDVPSATELARALADALERQGLPYAVGGAIALGYYAPPRATLDVDLNVFIPPASGIDQVLDVLGTVGFTPSPDADTADVL